MIVVAVLLCFLRLKMEYGENEASLVGDAIKVFFFTGERIGLINLSGLFGSGLFVVLL